MANNKLPGLNVIDNIVPLTANDTYATHLSTYGKGGWREVDTIAQMNAITEERRSEGMAVFVNSERKLYILINNEFVPYATSAEGDKTFTLEINRESEVWTVTHNLNKKPSVHTFEGDDEIFGDISYPDLNTVEVRFSIPVSGKIILN